MKHICLGNTECNYVNLARLLNLCISLQILNTKLTLMSSTTVCVVCAVI